MSTVIEIPPRVAPGQLVEGTVRFDAAIARAEIAVEWIAQQVSCDPRDAVVVLYEAIEEPRAAGAIHAFRFRVPLTPPSYVGRHFSLRWRVLVRAKLASGGDDVDALDFDVK